MNYRSLADLNRTIGENLHRLPPDVDVVVGIPRSGLLAASLIALALNLPLADLDGFRHGRLLRSGSSRRRDALDRTFAELRHALVVDDSTLTGAAMKQAREHLLASPVKTTFAAVYGVGAVSPHCDLTFEAVAQPRIFEWNILHHDVLASACVDIDGILCFDPTEAENDDAEHYLRFLENAKPLHRPTKKIGALVTSRLEKYRVPTERWLKHHHIAYEKLVMLDLPDAKTRRERGAHATFKAGYYKSSPAFLFIESEIEQARQIAALSGKDVLCFANHQVFRPDALTPIAVLQGIRRSQKWRRLLRRMIGEKNWDYLKRRYKSPRRA